MSAKTKTPESNDPTKAVCAGKHPPHIPFNEGMYCSGAEAAIATSLSRSRLYELMGEERRKDRLVKLVGKR